PVTRKSYEYESGYLYHAQPRRRAVVKNTTITPFEYEVDFNIGDIVDVFNKKWGVSLSTPIVEILEIHEKGGFRIEATFGDTRPTITKKLKKRFDDIEDIDKQEKYYEYVDKKDNEIKKEIEKTKPTTDALWTGTVFLMDVHTIIPTKKLSDCHTGWILQWQYYQSGEGKVNSNFQFSYIPKTTLSNGEGLGHRDILQRGSQVVRKYFYVYEDKIHGYDTNGESVNRELALTGVFEW